MTRFIPILVILCFLPFALGTDQFFNQTLFFRVSLTTDQQHYIWEYRNPEAFQYTVGQKTYVNERAKEAVMKLFETLDFEKNITAETLAQNLKQQGYKNLTKLKVWYRDADDRLYTWVWNQDGGY